MLKYFFILLIKLIDYFNFVIDKLAVFFLKIFKLFIKLINCFNLFIDGLVLFFVKLYKVFKKGFWGIYICSVAVLYFFGGAVWFFFSEFLYNKLKIIFPFEFSIIGLILFLLWLVFIALLEYYTPGSVNIRLDNPEFWARFA